MSAALQKLIGSLEKLAYRVTLWTGSSWAFSVALLLTLLWLISGPVFQFTDTWQLVMNTVSSIVTFLMVFLLQRSQNKDNLAMQIKLDELIASQRGASNRLINVEELSEQEVRALHQRYQRLAETMGKKLNCREATSIDMVSTASVAGTRPAEPGS